MTPGRATISNLILKSNLLSSEYPAELHRVSAFELDDIKRRNRILPFNLDPTSYEGVSRDQRRQWDSRLFWGDRTIRLTEARLRAWLEAQVTQVLDHLAETAGRIGEEQAFEILYLVEGLVRTRSPLAALAAEAGSLALEVLRDGAFGYSDSQIEQRLAFILNEPDFRLERRDGNRPDPDRR